MPNRNKNYDKVLTKKFEHPEYARNYLFHIVEEEDTSLDEALREVIKAMGLNLPRLYGESKEGPKEEVKKWPYIQSGRA